MHDLPDTRGFEKPINGVIDAVVANLSKA
jgi:hypothetical protein